MVFCPESNSLLFIGSPFLDGLDGLTCNGLFISDIPLHDATREVILVGEQARAQDGLRRRMDKLKSSIEEGNVAVMKERKKNVSLLHLIFPAEIAESLWLGMKNCSAIVVRPKGSYLDKACNLLKVHQSNQRLIPMSQCCLVISSDLLAFVQRRHHSWSLVCWKYCTRTLMNSADFSMFIRSKL